MPAIAVASAAAVFGDESLPTWSTDSRWMASEFSLPIVGVLPRSRTTGDVSFVLSDGSFSCFTARGVAAESQEQGRDGGGKWENENRRETRALLSGLYGSGLSAGGLRRRRQRIHAARWEVSSHLGASSTDLLRWQPVSPSCLRTAWKTGEARLLPLSRRSFQPCPSSPSAVTLARTRTDGHSQGPDARTRPSFKPRPHVRRLAWQR